jgi:hypothetical protein
MRFIAALLLASCAAPTAYGIRAKIEPDSRQIATVADELLVDLVQAGRLDSVAKGQELLMSLLPIVDLTSVSTHEEIDGNLYISHGALEGSAKAIRHALAHFLWSALFLTAPMQPSHDEGHEDAAYWRVVDGPPELPGSYNPSVVAER